MSDKLLQKEGLNKQFRSVLIRRGTGSAPKATPLEDTQSKQRAREIAQLNMEDLK